MANKCCFYKNGPLNEDPSYFVNNAQWYMALYPTCDDCSVFGGPYIVVCANPEKRT
eukprot:CAMPEP_0172758886 /NCGR_PEP_ID=MMETSP1074-20121228/166628_1 /TAXON_ID=2916 /ORGANISM="Ceratium fusus, Strain PA161109" /LENGTH=55 /DNA_ID=CAMNT_0013592551 /DNA_START=10 /DNA_END=174 /DNA_ORIENTATION=+